MAVKTGNVLVLCIDRDNDLGRKAKVQGPIIGIEANIDAVIKLGIADPTDSDTNAILAALKKFNEAKKLYKNVEIATLTGKENVKVFATEADKILSEQLDKVLERFPADSFIFVSDGAEDDAVLPIITSRIKKINSKEIVIVKQAKQVESTFYTIKEVLKDPLVAKIVFGIPGIILLIILALGSIGTQVVLGALGIFLLLYGFGLLEWSVKTFNDLVTPISTQRVSFVFYIGAFLIFFFGIFSAIITFNQKAGQEELIRGIESVFQMLLFMMISNISINIAKSIDGVYLKKAFKLGYFFRSAFAGILIYVILDSGKQVFLANADLNLFVLTLIGSAITFVIADQVAKVIDVRGKITKLLIGLPVYSSEGNWIGKVNSINSEKELIEIKEIKSKKLLKLKKNQFLFKEGSLFLTV